MQGNIIILGDSIMAWNKGLNFENYGEPGFTTLDLLWKLEENNDIIGDAAILMIGINDILLGYDLKISLENIKKILNILKTRVKKILLVSILPTSDERRNNDILIINKKLKTMPEVIFLDIYNLFLGELKRIDNKFTGDGVHLNTYAYEILNKKIKEALQ